MTISFISLIELIDNYNVINLIIQRKYKKIEYINDIYAYKLKENEELKYFIVNGIRQIYDKENKKPILEISIIG